MKSTHRARAAATPVAIKGTTGDELGRVPKKPRRPVSPPDDDPTGRYQKKTGQIKRDFGR